jgi:pimeloyl-ACP methyl ester carboxylesterase
MRCWDEVVPSSSSTVGLAHGAVGSHPCKWLPLPSALMGLILWGFGESARDPMRYSIDQQTDLLSRFLDEMGIGKVALVGHGLGALVGFQFLCPVGRQSVDRVMAVNCPMYYDSINARLRTCLFARFGEAGLVSKTPEAATALADATKADPAGYYQARSAVSSRMVYSAKMRQTLKSPACSSTDSTTPPFRYRLPIIPSTCHT